MSGLKLINFQTLIINREGNFDTVFAQNRNAYWNGVGRMAIAVGRSCYSNITDSSRDTGLSILDNLSFVLCSSLEQSFRLKKEEEVELVSDTRLFLRLIQGSQGDRVLSRALIPFIRARNVTFTVTGMKPLTKVYPFFDKTLVTNLVTPTSGSRVTTL